MNKRFVTLLTIAGLMFAALLTFSFSLGGSLVAAQGSAGEVEDNDADDANEAPDVPITGSALDSASTAALDYIGEGRVTETEVGDEEGYYEVEITRDNGSQVDVHLDENFIVLGHEDD